ncbi:hypothetical protein ACQE98_01850 [Ornithinimicrobium sp. W1679]|uniref:hypothetical protein n=1 Tax=Ornithinimicrobium sp. W1679 TaxID=3418770 RepID=UPI003CEA0226
MTPTDASHPGSSGPGSEADPTGMRALLSSLPDPGPMPEDLVRRIEARLAVEAHAAARPSSRPRPADHLVDLAAERSRRRPGRTVAILGVAAAGLLTTTVGLGQALDGGIFGSRTAMDTAAQYPSGADAAGAGGQADAGAGQDDAGNDGSGADEDAGADQRSDDSATEMDDGAAAGGAQGGTEEAAGSMMAADAPSLPEDVQILGSLGTVTREDYLGRVQQVADGSTPQAEAGRLTWSQVAGCWSATGSPHRWDSVHAAEAELSDDPVVVLLGTSGDRGEAFLMPWPCTTVAESAGDAAAPLPLPLDHAAWPSDP